MDKPFICYLPWGHFFIWESLAGWRDCPLRSLSFNSAWKLNRSSFSLFLCSYTLSSAVKRSQLALLIFYLETSLARASSSLGKCSVFRVTAGDILAKHPGTMSHGLLFFLPLLAIFSWLFWPLLTIYLPVFRRLPVFWSQNQCCMF